MGERPLVGIGRPLLVVALLEIEDVDGLPRAVADEQAPAMIIVQTSGSPKSISPTASPKDRAGLRSALEARAPT
jgi:hypothetical protein